MSNSFPPWGVDNYICWCCLVSVLFCARIEYFNYKIVVCGERKKKQNLNLIELQMYCSHFFLPHYCFSPVAIHRCHNLVNALIPVFVSLSLFLQKKEKICPCRKPMDLWKLGQLCCDLIGWKIYTNQTTGFAKLTNHSETTILFFWGYVFISVFKTMWK